MNLRTETYTTIDVEVGHVNLRFTWGHKTVNVYSVETCDEGELVQEIDVWTYMHQPDLGTVHEHCVEYANDCLVN
jgi:hypothetical protein